VIWVEDGDVQHDARIKRIRGVIYAGVCFGLSILVGLSSTDLQSSNLLAYMAGQVDWALNGFDAKIELNFYGAPCDGGVETGGRVTGLKANLAAEVRYYSEFTGDEFKEDRARLDVKSRGVAALPTLNWAWATKNCPVEKKYVIKMVVTQDDLASRYKKVKTLTFDLFVPP
jgi:hypothetical protein